MEIIAFDTRSRCKPTMWVEESYLRYSVTSGRLTPQEIMKRSITPMKGQDYRTYAIAKENTRDEGEPF